jgi:hypothetical protein
MAGERLAGGRRITLGPDKGYDTRDVVASCRALGILHTLRKIMRPGDSALDAHTVRYPGYALSQWMRKQVEEAFGWMKNGWRSTPDSLSRRTRVQMHAYLGGGCVRKHATLAEKWQDRRLLFGPFILHNYLYGV